MEWKIIFIALLLTAPLYAGKCEQRNARCEELLAECAEYSEKCYNQLVVNNKELKKKNSPVKPFAYAWFSGVGFVLILLILL